MNHTEGKFLFKPNNGDPSSYEELGDPLQAIQAAGLLPSGTLFQLLAPTDTSVFWGDISSNPHVLKRHNGAAWVAATFDDVYPKAQEVIEIFDTIGTTNWTVPDGIIGKVFVSARGGGGSGSGGSSDPVAHDDIAVGGGAGGQGGYVWNTFDLVAGDVYAVTVAGTSTGGSYLAAGQSIGVSGQASSFGTLLTANGGIRGQSAFGGQGGGGTGGNVQIGSHGQSAFSKGTAGRWNGGGGGSGGARNRSNVHSSGFDSGGTDGGGGGGANMISTTIVAGVKGGDGAQGNVLVRYFT